MKWEYQISFDGLVVNSLVKQVLIYYVINNMNYHTLSGFDTKVCRFYVVDRVTGDFVPYIRINKIEEDYRNIISCFDIVIPKEKIKFVVGHPFEVQVVHELEADVAVEGFYRRELAAKIVMLFREMLHSVGGGDELDDLVLVGVVYNPVMDMYMAMVKGSGE